MRQYHVFLFIDMIVKALLQLLHTSVYRKGFHTSAWLRLYTLHIWPTWQFSDVLELGSLILQLIVVYHLYKLRTRQCHLTMQF